MSGRLLVDAMNVIGSRPDGWWRDRDGAKRRLAAQLASLAESGHDVAVVFDGHEPVEPIEAPGVTVHFAPGGPNAADHRIVELLEADAEPAGVEVVTSDADLSRRARALGADVTGSGAFRRTLDAL